MPSLATYLAMALGYALSFYLLSLALREVSLGIAYAVWGGLRIFLVSLLGLFAFGQRLDLPAIIGLTMIVGGVLVIKLFSGSVTH